MKRLQRIAVLMVALAALTVVLPGAAMAQTSQLSVDGFQYPGRVTGFVPGGVQVGTAWGTTVVSSTSASLRVGGLVLSGSRLQTVSVGTPVTVVMPPMQGTLMGTQGQMIVLQTPHGQQVVPCEALPYRAKKQKVYVRLANGNVVHVPLNAAMNMQRSQGAMILGASGRGHGHGVHPQENPYDDGQGQSQGQGNGKGKGKGKGKGHH